MLPGDGRLRRQIGRRETEKKKRQNAEQAEHPLHLAFRLYHNDDISDEQEAGAEKKLRQESKIQKSQDENFFLKLNTVTLDCIDGGGTRKPVDDGLCGIPIRKCFSVNADQDIAFLESLPARSPPPLPGSLSGCATVHDRSHRHWSFPTL